MAVVRPVQFTEILDTEVVLNRGTTEELLRKMAQNINMLRALTPYAEVLGVHINLSGGGIPDPITWQAADGGEITGANPLNGPLTDHTPDMRGRYLRGAPLTVLAGNEAGGADTATFSHTHVIAPRSIGPLIEGGNERAVMFQTHTHDLAIDDVPVDLNPAHFKVAFYFRVFR